MNEKLLIERCLDGERAAEKELYDHYAGKMLSVCKRYMGDIQRAEDILQEGFIKVYNSLDQFSFNGSFEGYVRRIMINCALRELNRFRNKNESFGYDYKQEYSDLPDAVQQMSADAILNMVAALPPGYRTVFNLYVVDGFSHQEIAEKLDVSVNTSRTQLLKARKQLQEMILKQEKISQ